MCTGLLQGPRTGLLQGPRTGLLQGPHLGLWVWMKEVVFDPQPKDLLGAFIKRVSTSSSLRARRDTSPHAAAAAAQGRLRLRQRLCRLSTSSMLSAAEMLPITLPPCASQRHERARRRPPPSERQRISPRCRRRMAERQRLWHHKGVS